MLRCLRADTKLSPASATSSALSIRPRRPTSSRSTRLAASRSGASTHVKICGVTNPKDARVAADAGADFIGMIMWPKAKRSVSDDTAITIAHVAREHGAVAVGVFVDEDAETINRRCKLAGIMVAQLHGDGARASLPGISPSLKVVYVLNATPEGKIMTKLPDEVAGTSGRQPDWILLDGLQGGSGEALDWTKLQPPTAQCKQGWLLAGGLKPENVAEAIKIAQPFAVDVSSGVCCTDGLKKNADKITAFVQAVKGASP